jgi:hypothetical protein
VAFRSCCPRSAASPQPPHLSVPVEKPVSDLDCVAILRAKFSMSSRIYFNFRPYFIGVPCIYCGKDRYPPVDKDVENPATDSASSVKLFRAVERKGDDLWKNGNFEPGKKLKWEIISSRLIKFFVSDSWLARELKYSAFKTCRVDRRIFVQPRFDLAKKCDKLFRMY